MPDHPPIAHVDHVLDGIYIAGLAAIRSMAELRQAGIGTALKLYAGLPNLPADFMTLETPVTDGEAIPAAALRQGVAFLRDQVRDGRRVLVLCNSGESRSAAFVLAYLIEGEHPPREAFRLLKRAHPATELSLPMWQSLIGQYHLPYTLREVAAWNYDRD